MSAESAADRLAFLDPDEFGAAATYTVAGGAGVDVAGILNEPSSRTFGDMVSAPEAPTFTLRSADVPAGARGGQHSGDRLAIGDRVFRVALIEPDGTGMTVLTLDQLSL